jgi:hypothetical protein
VVTVKNRHEARFTLTLTQRIDEATVAGNGYRVYENFLCGAMRFVVEMRKIAFLRDINLSHAETTFSWSHGSSLNSSQSS